MGASTTKAIRIGALVGVVAGMLLVGGGNAQTTERPVFLQSVLDSLHAAFAPEELVGFVLDAGASRRTSPRGTWRGRTCSGCRQR